MGSKLTKEEREREKKQNQRLVIKDVADKIMNVKGIKVTCRKKTCQYTWTYKGNSRFFACCPMCKTPVKLGGKNGKKQ